MPIGVPRIIYCWGEELPAQWTDIYNFIFRRRMVFLMQYLDDELCNQICGLLINIHMEDRSKELEKKEIERSGLFKTASKTQKTQNGLGDDAIGGTSNLQSKKVAGPSFEDLLAADEDLGIDENNTLEQYTLQKITMEWLNWNAQFFDYSDEPYLFYLAEMLSKDFNKGDARMLYSSYKNENNNTHSNSMLENSNQKLEDISHSNSHSFKRLGLNENDQNSFPQKETTSFMQFFELFGGLHPSKEPFRAQNKPVSLPPTSRDILSRTSATPNLPIEGSFLGEGSKKKESLPASLRVPFFLGRTGGSSGNVISQKMKKAGPLDIYSPFRLLANFAAQDYNFNAINPLAYSGLNSHVNLNVNARAQETQGFFKEEFSKRELFKLFNNTLKQKGAFEDPLERVKKGKLFSVKGESLLGVKNKRSLETRSNGTDSHPKNNMSQLFTELGQKNFAQKINSQTNLFKTSEKALSQRSLRKEYVQEKTLNSYHISKINRGSLSSEEREEQTLNAKPFLQESLRDIGGSLSSSSPNEMNKKRDGGKLRKNPLNYLDFYSYNNSYTEFRNTQRGKQTERTLQEEEAKKVFVIINSFGGSVGNGITVHDALQFIKAGSLTLALGVAASAASLALAGGTIGERYVTEGCHVMIHQPESSIQGQASDIWIDSQEIMKIRLDVAEIYSLATYRPRHKILRDLDRDFYLTATETIHYGLADEIATNEVMHEIIEMTSKVWDYHDTKQQRLLESRDTSNSGLDTQSQN